LAFLLMRRVHGKTGQRTAQHGAQQISQLARL